MDWLTFISKIVESLAWPAVVGGGLWIFREQIPSAFSRLEEITLPGGAKATFAHKVAEAKSEKESIASEAAVRTEAVAPPDRGLLEMADAHPVAAVYEAYRRVEAILLELRSRLDLPARSNLAIVIRRLVEKGLVDDGVARMFDSFRSARNSAVHAQKNEGITPGDALEFINQSQFLTSVFEKAKTAM